MNEIISYLSHPKYINIIQKIRFGLVLMLIILYFLIALFFAIFANLLCHKFEITKILVNNNILETIIIGCFFAPIYEEFLFRSLLKFKKNNIVVFSLLSIIFIILSIIKHKTHITLIFVSILILLIFFISKFSLSVIEQFIISKFKYFFYFSVLSFGIVHLLNFTGNSLAILMCAPFLVGPQIILGLILGYIRMNNGLRYSILFHLIVNSSLLLSLLHK